MPTELDYTQGPGKELTEGGHEYGVTTGRRRRCGWFDGPIANYAARVNGLTHIALTKLDVLSAFDTIPVCVAYDCDGERYTTVPGWKCDISACRTFEELPKNAQDYVARLEELAHTPIAFVSVGPDREQTINRSWR